LRFQASTLFRVGHAVYTTRVEFAIAVKAQIHRAVGASCFVRQSRTRRRIFKRDNPPHPELIALAKKGSRRKIVRH
jgi:hypothetical protein